MGLACEMEAQGSSFATKPRVWAQLLASLGASMAVGGWAVGIGVGSVCVDQLSRGVGGFVLTGSQEIWTVTSNFIGTVVGSAVAGEFSCRFGAKNTMLGFCVPTVIGFIITSLANSFETLVAGRLLVGFCSGPAFVLHVFFISAIASPQYRGFLAMLPDIVYMLYVIASLLLGVQLPWWWVSAAGCALFSVPTMLALTLVPSDPVWLLRCGRLDEAKHAARFYGLDLPTDSTEGGADDASKSLWSLLRQPSYYRPLLLSAALLLGVAFCGYMAVLSYSLVLLRELGTPADATLVSVLLCVVRIVTVAAVAVLIDRAGRRTLLLVSAAGMLVSYLAVAACFYVPALAGWPALPMAALALSVFFFCAGVGPVPWCLIGEIVPPRAADAAGAALVFHYNMASLVAVQLFPAELAALGVGGVFALHAAIMAAVLVLIAALVPETRGLTLEQIGRLFQNADDRPLLVKALPPPSYSTFAPVGGG